MWLTPTGSCHVAYACFPLETRRRDPRQHFDISFPRTGVWHGSHVHSLCISPLSATQLAEVRQHASVGIASAGKTADRYRGSSMKIKVTVRDHKRLNTTRVRETPGCTCREGCGEVRWLVPVFGAGGMAFAGFEEGQGKARQRPYLYAPLRRAAGRDRRLQRQRALITGV